MFNDVVKLDSAAVNQMLSSLQGASLYFHSFFSMLRIIYFLHLLTEGYFRAVIFIRNDELRVEFDGSWRAYLCGRNSGE